MLEFLFNKVAGLTTRNTINKRLRCLPMINAKVLRTAFFIEHLWCPLLNFEWEVLRNKKQKYGELSAEIKRLEGVLTSGYLWKSFKAKKSKSKQVYFSWNIFLFLVRMEHDNYVIWNGFKSHYKKFMHSGFSLNIFLMTCCLKSKTYYGPICSRPWPNFKNVDINIFICLQHISTSQKKYCSFIKAQLTPSGLQKRPQMAIID